MALGGTVAPLTGLLENTVWDPVRLQPTQMQAGSLLTLQYYYCPNGGPSCASNNGNLLRQRITRTAPALVVTQDYTYADGFSRLTSSQEANSSGQVNWNQVYQYDNYGNRAVTSGYTPYPVLTPNALSEYVEQINGSSVNRNHWTGATFDGAGNVQSVIGTSRTYSYDAENRMTGSTEPNTTGPIQYVYDGDGRRVEKTVGTAVTVYVYDASGELAAEYGPATDTGTAYLSVDQLGSTRLMTDGTEIKNYDYFPFGEDIQQGIDGRDTTYPIGAYPGVPDSQDMKFTGKERDAETGLDYFEVRYMSSAQGRFTSPDPLTWQVWQYGSDDEKAKFQEFISDPQNFNLYAYVRNNPLKYTDPTGTYYCNGSDADCKKVEAAYNQAVAAAANKNLSKDERTAINNVLTFLGKPGEKNGVSVVFAATAKGSAADTDTTKQFGQTFTMITFNPQKIAGMDANALSETFIHEGTHGLNDFPLGHNPSTQAQEMGTEMNAYTNQSYVAEGLGVASRWGVWSPGITDANRQKAIKDGAQKSTRIWCQNGGVCK
jgi:RHS repeat-associated protein